ncbi:glycosyltransferase [Desulfobacterales bacterium HSG17]|nr:glycosyltransferase [Desulfobacterales bacterium HSG17]
MEKKISIIIPTFNEIKHGYINKILDELCNIKGIEIIIVDGGSTDGTSQLAKSRADRYFLIKNSNRAQRMNYGFAMSKADLVIFHHPRSFISNSAIDELKKFNAAANQDFWGGFTHRFDKNSLGLEFTSWYSNHIRRKISGIIYLDHCIFATRDLIKKTRGFPNREIFEDTVFSNKLCQFIKPVLLKNYSITSNTRFKQNGFFIQAILNLVMKACFLCRVSDLKMNMIYEKGLNLNKRTAVKTTT